MFNYLQSLTNTSGQPTILQYFPPPPPPSPLSMLFLECEPDLESPTTLILGEGGPCSQYELKN